MLVDSKKKLLDPPEIILEATKQTKSKYSPDQVLAAVTAEAHESGAILMRQGNTLFIVHPGKDRTALFRALNADTANNYLNNSVDYAKAMYMAGFDVMVTVFEDPTLLSIFKYIGKGKPKDMGYSAEFFKDQGLYQVTVKLGKPRK